MLQAFELAHGEIRRICDAIEDLRAQVGKPKWIDPALTAELESTHSDAIWRRIQEQGLQAAGAIVEEILGEICPDLTLDSTEEDIVREMQVKAGLALLLDKQRLVAVEGPVREQFETELRELTDAEQDSKELKSRKRGMLYDRIVENLQLPFPVGDGETEGKDAVTKSWVKKAADAVYKDLVRKKIAVEKRRPDGRGTEEIRPISVEVGYTPRTHGSGLFTRGETQILTLCTLGTAKEGQRIDDLSLESDRRYMHHYNFPPFSVGETGFMRGPKRRDIGHGALAQRALQAVIPSAEEFPYTIRLVSETLESNGSSSMGSVCGSTLSMMDAGVPISAPVSGIAMGLVKEGDDYVILTDIQGAEDHLGDMDFKVAGTETGITALQMDIKITGVTQDIMRDALEQAKRARTEILAKMAEAISEPRAQLAEHAPRISTIQINPEFIGMVIGKGGETIRGLEGDFDVQIDIEEDGTILVYATEGTKGEAAVSAIHALTKSPEVGDTYTGKVVKTTEFGAFVELKKGTDGLLHVSNVGPGPRRAHRGRDDARRCRRRARAGGRQGPRPDRPQAHREARGRRARDAGRADRAGEGRPAARAASASRRSRRSRPRPPPGLVIERAGRWRCHLPAVAQPARPERRGTRRDLVSAAVPTCVAVARVVARSGHVGLADRRERVDRQIGRGGDEIAVLELRRDRTRRL